MLGALLAFPFIGFGWLRGIDWLWAIVSGVAFGFALWTLFLAIKEGESTHINPFNGAMVTVFIYVFSSSFFKEQLTSVQIAGLIILIFACLLLSFEKSRAHNGLHIGFLWAIISGLLFAVSHVAAKYLYEIYPFWTGFIWTRATTGLVGLFLLLFPAVHATFFKKKIKTKQSYEKKHAGIIIVMNKILGVVGVILIQYAISIGSVTLVGALAGLQYVLMFILIYLLTKFLPTVFKEYFTKRELLVEIIAIILVAIGSVFFVL